ncbi:MAG: hypothetical protein AUK52_00165 [Comamonadaceae bacterium CG2_30_60_41]|nr:MAG: hypothetical protein AUK52_00165 [Comamonadaceae bacterium CG2_30_60_41]
MQFTLHGSHWHRLATQRYAWRHTDTKSVFSDILVRHTRCTIQTPGNTHTMNCHAFIAALLLVTTVSGANAQSLPKDSERPMARPLNLSVRPAAASVVDPAAPLQDQEVKDANPVQVVAPGRQEVAGAIVVLPYGTGFEPSDTLGDTPIQNQSFQTSWCDTRAAPYKHPETPTP